MLLYTRLSIVFYMIYLIFISQIAYESGRAIIIPIEDLPGVSYLAQGTQVVITESALSDITSHALNKFAL